MKLYLPLLLVLTASFGSCVVAQTQLAPQIPNLASPKEIAPPAYALNRIPAGGKSRFYGAAFFGAPLNEEVRVHLYQWPKLNPPPDNGAGRRYESDQNYRVDIFVRKQKKSAQFHLLQSVDIDNSAFGSERYAFDNVEFMANYLAPKNPEMPMIDLRCTVTGGFYGSFGADIVVAFNKGWAEKPYVGAFYFGGDNSEWFDTSFSLDSRGAVQILPRSDRSGAEAIVTEYWTWNGEKFVHTESEVFGADVKNPGRFKVEPKDD